MILDIKKYPIVKKTYKSYKFIVFFQNISNPAFDANILDKVKSNLYTKGGITNNLNLGLSIKT